MKTEARAKALDSVLLPSNSQVENWVSFIAIEIARTSLVVGAHAAIEDPLSPLHVGERLILHEPVYAVARLSPNKGSLSLGRALLDNTLFKERLASEELTIDSLARESLVDTAVDEVVAAALLLASKVDAHTRAHRVLADKAAWFTD